MTELQIVEAEKQEAPKEVKTCSGCVFSTTSDYKTKLYCAWEKHFLPPPVFRARRWGDNAPETWETAAENCWTYKARETIEGGTGS